MVAKAAVAKAAGGTQADCRGSVSRNKRQQAGLDHPPRQQPSQRRPAKTASRHQNTKRKATGRAGSLAITPPKHCSSSYSNSITESASALSDIVVARAIAQIVSRSDRTVRSLMTQWAKPIMKASIPGVGGQIPSEAMLDAAKTDVLLFFRSQQVLGEASHIHKAFRLASGEPSLKLDWDVACGRVTRARFDISQEIDSWNECLAMTSGDSNKLCEIYVCGTKEVTLAALTAVLCHEGLHNLARRTRRGNPYLSEEIEHIAMAMLGDPQLIHVAN